MKKESLSLLEQETCINFNRAESMAEVYTYEPSLKRKLAKLERTCDAVRLIGSDGTGAVCYELPKNFVTVRQVSCKGRT